MKSPSLASRSGSLHGDGGETPPPQQTAQVFSYDHASLPRSHRGSGTGSPKSPSHHRPPMRRGGTAIKKNVISLPSDLRHNTLAILPTEVVVTGCFTLKYSGGEGVRRGTTGSWSHAYRSGYIQVCTLTSSTLLLRLGKSVCIDCTRKWIANAIQNNSSSTVQSRDKIARVARACILSSYG